MTKGMPKFEPTPEQCRQVETMAGYGIPHVDIARLILSPRTKRAIDTKTLRAAFRSELDSGHVKANSAVAQSLFQQATSGNVTAAIWWTKARMGWKETVKQVLTGDDDKPLAPTIIVTGRPELPPAPEAVASARNGSH